MGVALLWAFCGAVGLVVLLLLWTFKTRRSRLIALGTLLPVVALGWVIWSAGQRPRPTAETIETDPSVFGEETHEAGASHATGAGHVNPAAVSAHTPAVAKGPSLAALLAALRRSPGLSWPDPGTRFTPSSLWNRINGAAEQFKKHGLSEALFATARSGEEDIEVQLFDFGSTAKARRHYDVATEGAKAQPLDVTAGVAITWSGGGEIVVDRFYAKLVVGAAKPSTSSVRAVETLLGTIAGLPGGSAASPVNGPTGPRTLKAWLEKGRQATGLTWPSPPDAYSPRTLWDRINGGAELYKKHGLKGALFITALAGQVELEVQLFELASEAGMAGLWADTSSPGRAALDGVAGEAVTWKGGGEVRVGRMYGRVVTSTSEMAPARVAALLRALGGAQQPSDRAQPEPAPPRETGPAGIAKSLGIGVHLVKHYGILRVESLSEPSGASPGEGGGSFSRRVHLRDGFAAAAWARSLRPDDAPEAPRDFEWRTPGEAALVRGAIVVWVRGEDAPTEATRAAQGLAAPTLPGVRGLGRAERIDIRLGGWAGKAFLGPCLVGGWPAEEELFVMVYSEAPDPILKKLLAGFDKVTKADADGVITASDEYHGDVIIAPKGKILIVAPGSDDHKRSVLLIKEVLADLSGPD